jgi:hypothetical protein
MKYTQDYESFISESLLYSEIKPYIEAWKSVGGETNYEEWFGDRWRIYLDLVTENSEVYYDVEALLDEHGYYIVDYRKNDARKIDDDRKFGIGKLLHRFNKKLKSLYDVDKDKKGVISDEYSVVISRHPYDIVGMSTDRDWHSCMNIRSIVDNNRAYVMEDVKAGSIVSYLIEKKDTNINNPINRLLIKPFYKDGEMKLVADAKIYKATFQKEIDGFRDTVEKWLVEKQGEIEGVYKLHPKLYADGKSVTVDQKVLKMLKKKYDYVSSFDNLYSIVKKGRLYGIVDVNGVEVTPVVYRQISPIGSNNNIDNTFYILMERDETTYKTSTYFFRVKDGIMSDKYDTGEYTQFSATKYVVNKDSMFGVIDLKTFETVVPFEYDIFDEIYSDYNDDIKLDIFRIGQGEYMGAMDIKGDIVIPIMYDDVDYSNVINNKVFYYVTLDGKVGIYNQSYELIIPLDYDNVSNINYGDYDAFLIELDGKFGFIDIHGVILQEPIYTVFKMSELQNELKKIIGL